MPCDINLVGIIKRGSEIGKERNPSHKYIWHACRVCGKQRWIALKGGEAISKTCLSCSRSTRGKESKRWQGGRILLGSGYIGIKLQPKDFFYPMSARMGYVKEHRLVMAKHLGRCLHSWEIVHHKNHVRDDNKIENLQLVTDDRHNQITIMENKIHKLEKRMLALEVENVLIRQQLEIRGG